jgi:two-component system KDP operon response regulator KdpE
VVRVLVIDDEPDVLLLCRVNLRHEGHEVLEAPDGATGLALATQEPPDVVVLDLMMPSVDGYDVLAALKGSASTEGVPVLILSAKAQIDERRRALESGGDAFLAKPFAPQELGEVVLELATIDPGERAEARQAALRELEAKLP